MYMSEQLVDELNLRSFADLEFCPVDVLDDWPKGWPDHLKF
jgi:hypothetical protein